MWTPSDASTPHRWHSNEFLLRLQNGEVPDAAPESTPGAALGVTGSAAPLSFIADDEALHESLAVARSEKFSAANIVNFGARNNSVWALDLLADRFTGGLHDWSSLRSVAVRFVTSPRDFDPTLDRMKLDDLWSIIELLHERSFDVDAERGLLRFTADRIISGATFDKGRFERLMELLLTADLDTSARALLPKLGRSNWRHQAIAAELEHPRFGGTLEAMLVGLNVGFHRFGIEKIALQGSGATPFQHLSASPLSVQDNGPRVTVVLTAFRPGEEIFAAVRSIIGQTYQNWELVVVDDGSGEDYTSIFEATASLDERVRVVRHDRREGTYFRRNEEITKTENQFVTFQDVGSWSHPRRIEIQARDLLNSPGKFANTVRAARLTSSFSLAASRGMRLFLADASMMLRRAEVIDLVGFFDTTRKGAGIELRTRIEAATGGKVGLVGPEAPLMFVHVDDDERAEIDFGVGVWTHPTWLAYRSAIKPFHERIRAGEQSARLPFPQIDRVLTAPRALLEEDQPVQVDLDLLIVLDGHQTPARAGFIETVVDEAQTACSAGLRVGLLHSDSPSGVRNAGPIAESLQMLIDSGQVTRVFDGDPVETELAVVRHAGAAQGHALSRKSVSAQRAVVVQDASAGDARGESFAKPDVDKTVHTWFGVPPVWTEAAAAPERPQVLSVIVDAEHVRVTLELSDPERVTAIRLGSVKQYIDMEPTLNASGLLTADGELAALPSGDLLISVVRSEGDAVSLQGCWVPQSAVLTLPAHRLLTANSTRGIRLSAPGLELSNQHLEATVSNAKVFRGEVELTVAPSPGVEMAAVLAIREVEGRIKSRSFTLGDLRGETLTATRLVADLVDTRWKLFARFLTPMGPVTYPLDFGEGTNVENSSRYRIRKLTDGGAGVLHLVPRETVTSGHVPVLSIVMPVFNVAPFLDASILSVLTQDFQDFELIIIDDASTDNGRKTIEMHRQLDPRIRVIELDHNTLGGAGVPSNLGIRAARGKYIGFVDSDDWVTKDAFSRMVKLAEAHDAEVVIGDFRTFDENSRRVTESYDSAGWRDIPLGKIISASSSPRLMRLSPVPWRKLYQREFMQQHDILYPEGDYFYEDNPLHWHVLSRAERVVATDVVVSYHRMEREGQTMGANEYKLGAIASHANTILNSLLGSTLEQPEALFEEFIDYVSRQRWTVRRQSQPAAAGLIKHRLTAIFDKAVAAMPEIEVPQPTTAHFSAYRGAYPDVDLTVVIPIYNSADLLRETLDSVLRLRGISFNILAIDDGSTDSSLKVLLDYEKKHENVHIFQQKNRGAGRARNAVIPLASGRYTYFLDADDTIDARALQRAVQKADVDDADLMFFKYRIDFRDEKRSRGMFNADVDIWQRLMGTKTNVERQELLSGLINYPWNRIIRTELLHDANIFFGPTVVHNDVLYHWHSILAASNIGYLDAEVCSHRKFKDRAQVTNINDERRMAVLEALRGTHLRISVLPSYQGAVAAQWQSFSDHLLIWAEDRVPEALREKYRKRAAMLSSEISGSDKE